MTVYHFQVVKNVDYSKVCENWQNFGENNEKYKLEGPFGEIILINAKTHQGYQFGYNALMMDLIANRHIIERIW